MSCMDDIFIGVWVEYETTDHTTFGSKGGDRISLKTKNYAGPFESWCEALSYIEEDSLEGAIIHDFT